MTLASQLDTARAEVATLKGHLRSCEHELEAKEQRVRGPSSSTHFHHLFIIFLAFLASLILFFSLYCIRFFTIITGIRCSTPSEESVEEERPTGRAARGAPGGSADGGETACARGSPARGGGGAL